MRGDATCHPEPRRRRRTFSVARWKVLRFAQRMIVKCMKHYDGNISRVAEALGLSRAALYRRFEKYGIEAE